MDMNLSSLCLEVIKSNFDVLMIDFLSPNGKIPPHHFEFLQRLYSKELLKTLVEEKGPLPDHYYKFLINVFLKELHANSKNFCRVDILIQRLIEVGHSIRVLDLSNSSYSEYDIHIIVSLVPNVEKLDLSQTEASDIVFEAINPSLHSLNISYCNITDAGLEQHCKKDEIGQFLPNPKLKHLTMCKSKVSKKGVVFSLMNFPSLETLENKHVPQVIYNIFLQYVSQVTLDTASKFKLKSLEWDAHTWPDFRKIRQLRWAEILDVLAFLCPEISSLTICNNTNTISTSTWALFSNLEKISITDSVNLMCRMNFTPLVEANLPLLKRVHLEKGKLSTYSLLNCCSQLEKLSLHDMKLEPIPDNLKSQCDKLRCMKSMEFSRMILDGQGKTVTYLLDSCPNLKSLKFCHCASWERMSIGKLFSFGCLSTLKNLSLNCMMNVKSSDVKNILLQARGLSNLTLGNCNISLEQQYEIESLIEKEGRLLSINWESSNRRSERMHDRPDFLWSYDFISDDDDEEEEEEMDFIIS